MAQTNVVRGVATRKGRNAITQYRTRNGEHRQLVDSYEVSYHNTKVVAFTRSYENSTESPITTILLDTGGYKTVTTKRRMNQAANEFGLPYHVFQQNHSWYLLVGGETFDMPKAVKLVVREETGELLDAETIREVI